MTFPCGRHPETDEGGAEIAPVEANHDRAEHRCHHDGYQHRYPGVRKKSGYRDTGCNG
jgi:hypothetical protein